MSNSDALGRTNKPWSVSEWETTFIDQGLTFQRRLSKIIGGRFLIVLILGNRRKMTVIELSAEGRSVISKLWLGASSAHLCLTWCLTEIWFSCSSNRGSMDWMSARISHLLCAPSPIFFKTIHQSLLICTWNSKGNTFFDTACWKESKYYEFSQQH